MTAYLETARGYLLSHQFDALERWLLELHEASARDPDSEAEARALTAAESTLRSVDEATAAWLRQSPQSYGALMFRGQYLYTRGTAARGSATANHVASDQWRRMQEAFAEAAQLFHRAAQQVTQPGLALSMIGRIAWIGGEAAVAALPWAEGEDWYSLGLRLDPASYELRAARLQGLRPEWGGSLDAMHRYLQAPEHAQLSTRGRQRLQRLEQSTRGWHLLMFKGQSDEGLALMEQAVSELPDDPWGYYWPVLAMGQEPTQQAQAVAWGERGLALYPEYRELMWEVMQARWRIEARDPKVLAMLKRLTQLGHVQSFVALGRYHDEVLDDGGGAYNAWKRGADEGIAECAWWLAKACYGQGRGVDADPSQAAFWYLRAYALGWRDAVLDVCWLLDAQPVEGYSLEGLAPTLIEAAEVYGVAGAHSWLAQGVDQRGWRYDPAQGAASFRTVATPLDQDAEGARLYVYHLEQAAERGYPYAQVCLGDLYRRGRFVEQSNAQAEHWLRAAEDSDNANQQGTAKYYLGLMIQSGAIAGTQAEAVQCFHDAIALHDHTAPWAMHGLARAYERGLGVKKDRRQALEWAQRAEAGGAPLPDDLKHLSQASDHSDSAGSSVFWHLLIGPAALSRALLVGFFGKSALGRWAQRVLIIFMVIIVALGAWGYYNSPRKQPAAAAATSAEPADPNRKPSFRERVERRAAERRAREAALQSAPPAEAAGVAESVETTEPTEPTAPASR